MKQQVVQLVKNWRISLNQSTSIQSLADYPVIGIAFTKAHSTLLSSVAVEGLFSTAGMILTLDNVGHRTIYSTSGLFEVALFVIVNSVTP